MIGNYGVPSDKMKHGIHKYYESHKLHIKGLIISDYSFEYSHWNAEKSLSDWLKEFSVPGLFGIDTRALTKILREKGSMLGKIEFEDKKTDFYDPNRENLVAVASCRQREEYGDGENRVVLIDCGVKNNIIRCLLKRGVKVIRVPWNYDFTGERFDGVFISNGPGDPAMCTETILNIQKLIEGDTPVRGASYWPGQPELIHTNLNTAIAVTTSLYCSLTLTGVMLLPRTMDMQLRLIPCLMTGSHCLPM